MYSWPSLVSLTYQRGRMRSDLVLVAGAPDLDKCGSRSAGLPERAHPHGTCDSGLVLRAGSHAGITSVGHQWQPEEPIPEIRHTTLPYHPGVAGRPPIPLTPVCSCRGSSFPPEEHCSGRVVTEPRSRCNYNHEGPSHRALVQKYALTLPQWWFYRRRSQL